MAESTVSVFTDENNLEAALRAQCPARFVVLRPGPFRAGMRRIALRHLSLLHLDEQLPRIAFARPPTGSVLIVLPFDPHPAQRWAGVPLVPGELLTLHKLAGIHAWTTGPAHTLLLCSAAGQLGRIGARLSRDGFAVPEGVWRWRPQPDALRALLALVRAALRVAEIRPDAPTEAAAGRGLERQIIESLAEMLGSATPHSKPRDLMRRCAAMGCLEEAIRTGEWSQAALADRTGVAPRTLRAYCKETTGLGPSTYARLSRLHAVREALQNPPPGASSVADLAQRYGFRQPGRFASSYRKQFGELPSAARKRTGRT